MEVRRISKRYYCHGCQNTFNELMDPDHPELVKCPKCDQGFLEIIEKGAICPSDMKTEEKKEKKAKEEKHEQEDYDNAEENKEYYEDLEFSEPNNDFVYEDPGHAHVHGSQPPHYQVHHEHVHYGGPHVGHSPHHPGQPQGYHEVHYTVHYPNAGVHHSHSQEENKHTHAHDMHHMPHVHTFAHPTTGVMPGFPQPSMGPFSSELPGFSIFNSFFPEMNLHEYFNEDDPDFSENFEFNNDDFGTNFMSNYSHINLQDFFENLPEESGNERPPASKKSVSTLPVFKVEKKHCKKGEKDVLEPPNCAICCSNINLGVKAQLLPCGHMFHPDCTKPWFQQHNTCPICRYELPTDDPTYEQQRRRNVATRRGQRRSHAH